jgi:CheY-like chemotaxis protein
MKTALVIEDNENNMELITFILKAAGYATICAQTGREGFSLAKEKNPDFIILDIQLPDIEGTEVLKMVRDDESMKHMPVIAVTSYAMSGDRERMLNAGCDGYIEKPIDPDMIVDHIKSIIGD